MDDLRNDVQGILSLYEACHLRLHGEDILEEALGFTTTHLTFFSSSISTSSMAEQISHSVKRPLYKCTTGLEAKYQIGIYELDPSHHAALLKLPKFKFYSSYSSSIQVMYKN